MKLHELSPKTKRKERKRVGRGMRSGSGKTCNRGHRGQGQRSGTETKPGFEGGQMPLYRRVPKKKQFVNPNTRHWAVINVGRLNAFFEDGDTVDEQSLIEKGLINKGLDGVRVLGSGTLEKKLVVKARYTTASAKEKIEAKGGSVELLELPTKDEAK